MFTLAVSAGQLTPVYPIRYGNPLPQTLSMCDMQGI